MIKIKNPMDHAAMIFVNSKGKEEYRVVGYGRNERIIYPDGRIVYQHPFPEKITEVKY